MKKISVRLMNTETDILQNKQTCVIHDFTEKQISGQQVKNIRTHSCFCPPVFTKHTSDRPAFRYASALTHTHTPDQKTSSCPLLSICIRQVVWGEVTVCVCVCLSYRSCTTSYRYKNCNYITATYRMNADLSANKSYI